MKRKSFSAVCNQCGETLVAVTADELQHEQRIHMYERHPIDFAKKFVQAVPNVRKLGTMIGAYLRENLK